jgi:hypothetical protein
MGVHTGMLAFESPLLLSVTALVSGGIWLLLWTRTRIGYMLLLAAGWWLLCCYWGLLAISAGPAPALSRGEIASIVRITGMGAAAVLAGGKGVMLWRWWRADRCCRAGRAEK